MTSKLVPVVLLSMMVMGCSDFLQPDLTPPTPPQVIVASGFDGKIEIDWVPSPEHDVAGYRVYTSYAPDGRYTLLGSTDQNWFIDHGLQNGTTYYYTLSAYDRSGNESPLSPATAAATPRPEGRDVALADYLTSPDFAGYDFSTYSVGPYDDLYTDVYFEFGSPVSYLDVPDDTNIQDVGYTTSLDDVTEAPNGGWSPTKDARLIRGHTYVVQTWDNHYAKMRIISISSSYVTFDWAYQLQTGNLFLKSGTPAVRQAWAAGAGALSRK